MHSGLRIGVSSWGAQVKLGMLAVLVTAGVLTPRLGTAQVVDLVVVGDNWRYFKGTEAPPVDWTATDFDDSLWLEGPTGLGYGDNDDATVLDDMQNGYVSVFARREFVVGNLADIERLVLRIDYDDGFVAYINGTEVARSTNIAGTPPSFTTETAADHEANGFESFVLAMDSIVQGSNILAIQLHNTNAGSSDASLIPWLLANASLNPTGLACAANTDGEVEISWVSTGVYESVRVLRNDVEIAALVGTATDYIDATPDLLDNTYEVIAEADGESLTAGTCNIACTQGTLDCVLELVGGSTQATLTWSDVPANVDTITIAREGAVLETIPGTATEYVDPDVEIDQPENDTDFSATFTLTNGRTCTLRSTANQSLCPLTLTARVQGGDVILSWDNVVKAWDHYEVTRTSAAETVVVATNVPGDASEWIDTDVILDVGEAYDYLLHPVAVAGGEIGTGCDATVTLGYAPELGSYNPPAGGWDYEIDFTGANDARYNPTVGETGNLDGNWIRSVDRDRWDGSAPFVFGDAPDGLAPGGVDIVDRPGEGSCGSNTRVLRILDPGDPGAAAGIGTAFPDPYTVPNNSRILLGLDLGLPGENVLKTGITFSARIRLSPDAPAYMNPQAASGDGAALNAGVGHVGVYHRPGAGGTNVSAAFALQSGADGGALQFSYATTQDIDAVGVGNFLWVWTTVQESATADTYDVNIYVNGGTVPSMEISLAGAALQTGTTDMGAGVVNFLAIGSHGTGDDAMIDFDRVAYKIGVFPPGSTPCGGGGANFRRGDPNDDGIVNITDGIFTLNYLFTGGATPACEDAADSNDDGTVNITDGIHILNYLFLGGQTPPSPGPDSCGPDATPGDAMTECASTQC